jgi:hypothetical protein
MNKVDTTSEWIILDCDDLQFRDPLEGTWHKYQSLNFFRIRNPYYIKPEPSVFDRCVVGQTVIGHKDNKNGSYCEFLVTGKGEGFGSKWVLYTEGGRCEEPELSKTYCIIRGGKE